MNTNSGRKLYICATAQVTALDAAGYAALTWVRVIGVGKMDAIGTKQNILNYDTWDTDVIQKAKGLKDAGSPQVEIARNVGDNGQDALRAAALVNLPYAFKIEGNDKLTSGGSNGLIYNRGYVGGPERPQGRNEDFDLEMFSMGFIDLEIVVDPT
jgi:hypothetical protein